MMTDVLRDDKTIEFWKFAKDFEYVCVRFWEERKILVGFYLDG